MSTLSLPRRTGGHIEISVSEKFVLVFLRGAKKAPTDVSFVGNRANCYQLFSDEIVIDGRNLRLPQKQLGQVADYLESNGVSIDTSAIVSTSTTRQAA